MGFLKGHIDITDNLDFITDLLMNPIVNTLIINLDEDRHLKGNNVVGGAILLPPPEAVMAEIDGDEQSYDIIYNNYFSQPLINQFMMGVINYLYNGGNLVMYFPSLDTSETKTISKLLNMIWMRYGIGIGIVGQAPGAYNEQYIPLWLNKLYEAGTIDGRTFLRMYPINTNIEEPNLERLVQEIRPYAENYQKQVEYIYRLVKVYKEKPNIRLGIYKVEKV